MKNLSRLAERFVKEHLNHGRLDDFILEAVYRNDVVEALKKSVCKSYSYGSYTDGFKFGFSPRSVCIEDEDGRAECTIVEFADAMLTAALKLCIKAYGADTVPKISGRKTGEPEEDGRYIIFYGITRETANQYDQANYSKEKGWELLRYPITECDCQVFAWCDLPGK